MAIERTGRADNGSRRAGSPPVADRTAEAPSTGREAAIEQLQRQVGNRAVTSLIEAKTVQRFWPFGSTTKKKVEPPTTSAAPSGVIEGLIALVDKGMSGILFAQLSMLGSAVRDEFITRLVVSGRSAAFMSDPEFRTRIFGQWLGVLPPAALGGPAAAVLDALVGRIPDSDTAMLAQAIHTRFGITVAPLVLTGPVLKRAYSELLTVPAAKRAGRLGAIGLEESSAGTALAYLLLAGRTAFDEAIFWLSGTPRFELKAKVAEFCNVVLTPWVQGLPKGDALSPQERAALGIAVKATTELPFAMLAASTRFSPITFGKTDDADGVPWEIVGLKRLYATLEALPMAHVVGNKKLIEANRYNETGISGYYASSGEAAIGYSPGRIDDVQSSDPNDPLHGVKRFEKVIRHEVGHAVDAQLGWSEGSGPSSASRGGWKRYGKSYAKVIGAIFDASGGAISKLEPFQKGAIIGSLVPKLMASDGNRVGLGAAVRSAPGYSGLPRETRVEINNDPGLDAISVGLATPWYNDSAGGIHLGEYVFQEAYDWDGWYHYKHEARSRKVSQYQFRAPGEWFAEAYAAYYEPDPRGLGAKLADSDPATKEWFDKAVNKMKVSRPAPSRPGGTKGAGG